MSQSRPNQASQTGMAVLAIVVLFGALFLGLGGWTWVRVRAERAAAEQAMQMAEQAQYAEQARQAARKISPAASVEQPPATTSP